MGDLGYRVEWKIEGEKYYAECRIENLDTTKNVASPRSVVDGLRRVFGQFTIKDDAEFLEMIGKQFQLRAYIPLLGIGVVEKVESIDSRHHRVSFKSSGEVKRI
jgi:hypothetical protein